MATRGTGASPANVTKHLKGIDFPANKQDLVKHAKHLHAEKVVLDEINNMPDQEYTNMADVMKSFKPEYEESKTRQGSSSRSESGESRSGGQSGHGKSSHARK